MGTSLYLPDDTAQFYLRADVQLRPYGRLVHGLCGLSAENGEFLGHPVQQQVRGISMVPLLLFGAGFCARAAQYHRFQCPDAVVWLFGTHTDRHFSQRVQVQALQAGGTNIFLSALFCVMGHRIQHRRHTAVRFWSGQSAAAKAGPCQG